MDLIRQNDHAILPRKSADVRERPGIPEISGRIMRVAQEQHGRLRLPELLLQQCKINGESQVFLRKRAFESDSPIAADAVIEAVVDRRKDNDIVAGSCQLLDGSADGRQDAGAEQQM